MADATTARSDDASRSAPLCPPERMLGTHRIDYNDDQFQGLPDLTTGRTLADAIASLDWISLHDRSRYAREWLNEMRDIGLTVQRVRSENGPSIEVGHPCDIQMKERQLRGEALAEHFQMIEGGRDAILSELRANGSVYGYMFRVPA